jgi:NAD(P)-dependent dehydrogenase (short-subunit alcohol dehydrogenase family)
MKLPDRKLHLLTLGTSTYVSSLHRHGAQCREYFAANYLVIPRKVWVSRCDVTNWEHQAAMFEDTIKKTPNNRVDIVIANAGISGQDPVFVDDGKHSYIRAFFTLSSSLTLFILQNLSRRRKSRV